MASFADYLHEIQNIMDIDPSELNEEQSKAWYAMLEELNGAVSDKVDAFAGFLRLEAARAKAIKEEASYLTKKARAIENKIDNIKSFYMRTMIENNLTKVVGTTHKISLRNNKSVCVDDAAIDTLPDEFLKVEKSPIKTAIKKALEEGREISGCSIVETQSLMVA